MPKMKKLTQTCSCGCGYTSSVEVDEDKYNQYTSGPVFHSVQDMFPELTTDQREFFFLTRICPTCWDELMKEEDEELINEEYNEQQLRDGGIL